jgi:L,D-peptidoglycan transpeptidase YkuD (ErfK/YbiS/YcfS/YnhG family)
LDVYVRTLSASATTGIVIAGGRTMRCAIGRGGVRARKREGDGASPRGAWRVMWAVYRCDRVRRVAAGVPMRPIRETDGWCDAPADRNYNRPVRLPYPASAERMYRDDGLYDYVVVLDYNMNARRRGLGSAIFLHCARDGYTPTAGCLALSRADLQWLLRRLTPRSRVRFGV